MSDNRKYHAWDKEEILLNESRSDLILSECSKSCCSVQSASTYVTARDWSDISSTCTSEISKEITHLLLFEKDMEKRRKKLKEILDTRKGKIKKRGLEVWHSVLGEIGGTQLPRFSVPS